MAYEFQERAAKSSAASRTKRRAWPQTRPDSRGGVYLALLPPVDFFSPPWLLRLLLAAPAAFGGLLGFAPAAAGLRGDGDSEGWFADFMLVLSSMW